MEYVENEAERRAGEIMERYGMGFSKLRLRSGADIRICTLF
jgi:hypothetical protein